MVLTSVLGDVSYPWESLVATLLDDLQVTHLFKNQNKFSMDQELGMKLETIHINSLRP